MPLVCAFDPGEVTGWSSWYYDSDIAMTREDYGLIKHGRDGFIDWCMDHHPLLREAIVVVEHYVPDGGAQKGITPIQIEGALAAVLAYLGAPPPVEQRRSVKRQVSDALLKANGLWLDSHDPAIDHEDSRDVHDSEIHALAWAKMRGHEPTLGMYWPER